MDSDILVSFLLPLSFFLKVTVLFGYIFSSIGLKYWAKQLWIQLSNWTKIKIFIFVLVTLEDVL